MKIKFRDFFKNRKRLGASIASIALSAILAVNLAVEVPMVAIEAFGYDVFVPAVFVKGESYVSIDSNVALAASIEEESYSGEILSLRSENSKTYDLGNGNYRLESKIGAVHYGIEGNWQDIDNAWVPAVAPWNWYMEKDSYHTYVLEDFTAGQVLKFESQGSNIAFQPMELQWTNDSDQIQSISMPQNVPVSVTNELAEMLTGMESSIGKIRWDNAYGTGRHFEWTNTPGRLEKILQLDTIPPTPAQYILDGSNPAIRLSFIFDPSSDLDIYVDGALWDKKSKKQTVNQIEFRKAGELLWVANPARYWDSSEDIEQGEGIGTTVLDRSGNKLYISVLVPYEWLQTATYPIKIDPTWQVGASSDDAHRRLNISSWNLALTRQQVGAGVGVWQIGGGMRFTSITIPSGATINQSYLTLRCAYNISATTVRSRISAEDVDDAATFADNAAAFDTRWAARTTARVNWDSIPAWTANVNYNSPEIKTVIQEIVDRALWASGNDIVIFWDDFENRSSNGAYKSAYSYDGSTTYAPKLVIAYTSCSEDISNTPSSENLGTVAASSTYYAKGSAPSNPVADGECTFTITNSSGGAVDLTMKATNFTGGNGWTLTSGAPGSDTVRMTAYYSGQNPASGVVLTTSYQAFKAAVADAATLKWDFKLETGTFTDGAQKSSTITISAACSA